MGIDTASMKIYGSDGCNSIFGDMLKINNYQIEINRIGGTKVYCLKISYDSKFRGSLKAARTYQIKRLKLFLFDKNEELLLEFERVIWEE